MLGADDGTLTRFPWPALTDVVAVAARTEPRPPDTSLDQAGQPPPDGVQLVGVLSANIVPLTVTVDVG
jgi:hypothetical protein